MRREKKRQRRSRPATRRFARAVLPPGKFHSTKRGKRGYSRRESGKKEREARQEEQE